MIELNPQKRYRISDILDHPWFSSITDRETNLFTEDEKVAMAQFSLYGEQDSKQSSYNESFMNVNFTERDIESSLEDVDFGDKSVILAPFNTKTSNENLILREKLFSKLN